MTPRSPPREPASTRAAAAASAFAAARVRDALGYRRVDCRRPDGTPVAAPPRGVGGTHRAGGRGHPPQAARPRAVSAGAGGVGRAAEASPRVMAASDYADWLQRGRVHMRAGRPIDAVLCFRRAAQREPARGRCSLSPGRDAVAAGLDRRGDRARGATPRKSSATFLAARLALAEGLLARGDYAGAQAAAAEALALAPRNCARRRRTQRPRRRSGDRAALASTAPGCCRAAAACDAAGLRAGACALRSSTRRTTRCANDLVAQLAADGGNAAVGPAGADRSRRVRGQPGGADRHAAHAHLAAQRNRCAAPDHRRGPRARPCFGEGLAATHAAMCVAEPLLVPSLWPLRTGGAALRIAWLCRRRTRRCLPRPARPCRTAVRHLRPTDRDDDHRVRGQRRNPRARHCRNCRRGPSSCRCRRIPTRRTRARWPASDPDVLVDLAGMHAATGLFLAARPARNVWSLASVAPGHAPALIEQVHANDRRTGRSAARAARRAVPPTRRAPGACGMVGCRGARAPAGRCGRCGRGLRPRAGRATGLRARASPVRGARAGSRRPRRGRARIRAGGCAGARRRGYAHCGGAARHRVASCGPRGGPAARRSWTGRRTSTPLWLALGHAELARRDGAAAAWAFGQALRLAPADGQTYFNLGVALQMAGDTDEAVLAYQRALILQPDFPSACFNLGVLFQQQGRTDAAIAAYRQALALNPRDAAAYKNLGEVLFAAGRIDAWLANFRAFEAHCPTALSLAVQALEVSQLTGDYARLDRYLDGLRREKFPASRRTGIGRRAGGAAVPAAQFRRRARNAAPVRGDVRHRGNARLRRRRCRRTVRRAGRGKASRGLSFRRPARPRDGQADVAGHPASRPRHGSSCTSIRRRPRATRGRKNSRASPTASKSSRAWTMRRRPR